MANRLGSSYWLLPCCPWDFYGKFGRRKGGLSQYRAFLAWLGDLGPRLGFQVSEDRLKIPSTKRICHVGRSQGWSEQRRRGAIAEVLAEAPSSLDKTSAAAFLPRPAEERIRNCSALPRDLQRALVERIATALLPKPPLDEEWMQGSSFSIAQAVELITPEERRELKSIHSFAPKAYTAQN